MTDKIINNIIVQDLKTEQEEKIFKFYHQIEPKFNRNNKPNKVKFYMDFIKIIHPPDYLVYYHCLIISTEVCGKTFFVFTPTLKICFYSLLI